jgi:AraC family transcriptional regulator
VSRLDEKTDEAHRRIVTQVIQTMWDRLADPALTLETLARLAMYSPFHFDRIFRSVTGVPPRQFLAAMRLERAKEYLVTTELPITEIGLRVGYSSCGTFSTRFAKLVGLPPQQFRRHMEECIARLRVHHRVSPTAPLDGIPGICGKVTVPGEFDGMICVGLFPKPIPMGEPVVCTMVFQPGSYWLPPVSDGTYYLMSTAFRWDEPLTEYSLPRNNLRGRADGSVKIVNGKVSGSTDIILRPSRPYDPPILVSLPLLITRFLDQMEKLEKTAN